jgi:D-alanyl-D-alanine dipeptidase
MQAKLNDHYNFLNDTDEGDRTYVAYPGFSKHQKGIAVDVGLYSLATNEILPMPTDYLVLDETANVHHYSNQETPAAQNLKTLQQAMKQAGFSIYAGEWWHFNDLTLVEEVDPYQGNIYDVLVGIK